MDEFAELEGAGEHYQFLLQPVRDLTKNWDIDISQHLAEYVNNLINETESFLDSNGRRKLFNFAEAAVLISGSTNIYSKKVEYVYQIAATFFENLKDQREIRKRKANAANGDEENVDSQNGDGEGDEMEFDEKGNQIIRPPRIVEKNLKVEDMRNQLIKLAKPRPLLPIIPISFTMLADYEKTKVPLYNRFNSNEIIGNKDDFKINVCHIHEGIALLDFNNTNIINKLSVFREESSIALIRRTLRKSLQQTSVNESQKTVSFVENEEVDKDLVVSFGHESYRSMNVDDILGGDDYSVGDFDDPNDGDNFKENENLNSGALEEKLSIENQRRATTQSMAGFTQVEMDLNNASVIIRDSWDNPISQVDVLASYPNNSHLQTNNDGSQLDTTLQAPPHSLVVAHSVMEEGGSSMRTMRSTTTTNNNLTADTQFVELDPFEEKRDKARPFRLNKNCFVDAAKQVKARNQRIERECKANDVPNISSLKTYIESRMFRRKLKKRNYALALFNTYLMDSALLSLNPLIFEEEKRRAAILKVKKAEAKRLARESRSLQRQINNREELLATTLQQNDFDAADFADGNEFDDPADELGVDEIINPNEPDEIPEQHSLGDDGGGGFDMDDLENSLCVHNLYRDSDARQNQRPYFSSIGAKNSGGEAARRPIDETFYVAQQLPDELPPSRPISQMGYDELVTYHLKKYWSTEEELTSKFQERVQQWEEKMNPLLDEEQSHPEFDVHYYGNQLIQKFPDGIGSSQDFSKIVEGIPNYELSRYFLVTLMLANRENVEIVEEQPRKIEEGHPKEEKLAHQQQPSDENDGLVADIHLKWLRQIENVFD